MAADGISTAQLDGQNLDLLPSTNAHKSNGGKPKVRRRTKSGCLTCRKRRIKCDEFRPICNNCIKSKRDCEGYNPRIGFRDLQRPSDPIRSDFTFSASLSNPIYAPPPSFANPAPAASLIPIRPRLAPGNDLASPLNFHALNTDFQRNTDFGINVDQVEIPSSQNHYPAIVFHDVNETGSPNIHWNGGTFMAASRPSLHTLHQISTTGPPVQERSQPEVQLSQWAAHSNQSEVVRNSFSTMIRQNGWDSDGSSPSSRAQTELGSNRTFNSTERSHTGDIESPMTALGSNPSISQPDHLQALDQLNPDLAMSGQLYSSSLQITQALESAAVEVQDDDYNDVFSDEEIDVVPVKSSSDAIFSTESVAISSHGDKYADRGIIDTYRAERVANPLRNPNTSRVFAHFIASTGPMLSLHERQFPTEFQMSDRGPVPLNFLNTWTYTLPMMALHNQSLLHAMLAVSSLHIARLQGAPATSSLKHYAYSLKRVHHAVSHERKRHEVTTLAATLLLGFYEIMTAEHAKWSTHLHGATQLIKEIDYLTITEEMISHKSQQGFRMQSTYNHFSSEHNPESLPQEIPESIPQTMRPIDMQIIDMLTGQPSNPRLHHPYLLGSRRDLSEAEVRNHEVLQDLNWWYRRQDIYHSLISGNPLLMDYKRWSECPPRASLGEYNAIHGSFDHLLLLLGRLATFIVTDRTRKLRVLAARAASKRPPPPPLTSKSGVPTSIQTVSSNPSENNSPQLLQNSHSVSTASRLGQNIVPTVEGHNGTPFYGMAPSTEITHMPRAFQAKRPSPPSQSQSQFNEEDLETATRRAEDEWNHINEAFKFFTESLGPEFQALSNDTLHATPTPFGPSITYRNPDVANIWLHYYTGRIVTLRSHPSMPPAAQMAVGVAARQTAELANEVGRIVAGMLPPPLGPDLNPISECSLPGGVVPLFFAGVQYRDASQRAWTIDRLRDIEYRTGWASAGLCANGCETSWVKAAQMGRGPSYEPVCGDLRSTDQRVSGKFSHLSGEPPTDPMDRRFIPFNQNARLVWASGLLGTEEDFSRMSLK